MDVTFFNPELRQLHYCVFAEPVSFFPPGWRVLLVLLSCTATIGIMVEDYRLVFRGDECLPTQAKLGWTGRRDYGPQVLLTLFIYPMAKRKTPSPRMAGVCDTALAFRVACNQNVPGHSVLTQFLQTCQIALEATKIAAEPTTDVYSSQNTLPRFAEESIGQFRATDAQEATFLCPNFSGADLPEAVRTPSDRPDRIDAALQQVAVKRSQAEAGHESTEPRATDHHNAITVGTFTRDSPEGCAPSHDGQIPMKYVDSRPALLEACVQAPSPVGLNEDPRMISHLVPVSHHLWY